MMVYNKKYFFQLMLANLHSNDVFHSQNQIANQQAMYVKQQSGAGGNSTSGSSGGDFFNKPQDPLSQLPQLQNNFADLSLNKDGPPVSVLRSYKLILN